jgi:16S rRNA processing protein RimM
MAADYRRIARISRAKGLAGAVVVMPVCVLPASAWENLRLWIVPPDHGLIRETRVHSVSVHSVSVHSVSGSDEHLLLSLDGVSDRATAQRLTGRSLLCRVEDCVLVSGEKRGSAVGLRVIDAAHGPLGVIVEERAGSAQVLWVVAGPFGEVLIPAVDEFIDARDEDAVRVSLPEGLLGLNA